MSYRTSNDPVEDGDPFKTPDDRPTTGIRPEDVEDVVAPCDDWILVRLDKAIERTRGGILAAARSIPEPRMGTVVRQGPGNYVPETGERAIMETKPGDRILFERRAGITIPRDVKNHLLIRAGSVCCIVNAAGEDAQLSTETVERDVAPVGDWSLLRMDAPRRSVGRIALPQNVRVEKHADALTATVVSTGLGMLAENGKGRRPLQAAPGDRVLFVALDYQFQALPGVEGYALVRLATARAVAENRNGA